MRQDELEKKWQDLISRLVAEGVLRSEAVIKAMRKVPRYKFVPDRLKPYAHVDTPLPIGFGQTVSAPHGPAGRPNGGVLAPAGPGDTWWP